MAKEKAEQNTSQTNGLFETFVRSIETIGAENTHTVLTDAISLHSSLNDTTVSFLIGIITKEFGYTKQDILYSRNLDRKRDQAVKFLIFYLHNKECGFGYSLTAIGKLFDRDPSFAFRKYKDIKKIANPKCTHALMKYRTVFDPRIMEFNLATTKATK